MTADEAERVPTEYIDGAWRFPQVEGPEPLAIVTWAEEPSPETGHVGWCWWALGRMGDAPTYEAACAAAEDVVSVVGPRARLEGQEPRWRQRLNRRRSLPMPNGGTCHGIPECDVCMAELLG